MTERIITQQPWYVNPKVRCSSTDYDLASLRTRAKRELEPPAGHRFNAQHWMTLNDADA
jgi:hypothetical protein